jgi:lipid II:glycine glycyltransferase (peptidoglycan interpeptide bridge formation enzyme)
VGDVKQSQRRNASRAARLGVTVARRHDADALDEFFRLHVLTRRKLGVPTQPRGFFRRFTELFERGLGFVLIARWQERPIAAAVYLRHRATLVYKYGASDPAHLDKRPNDLVQLEALRIACDAGCSELDLGRTEFDNDGLRRFKRHLGAEERELGYTVAGRPPGGRGVRSVSTLQEKLIRRAPSSFGRAVGAAAYRHFG